MTEPHPEFVDVDGRWKYPPVSGWVTRSNVTLTEVAVYERDFPGVALISPELLKYTIGKKLVLREDYDDEEQIFNILDKSNVLRDAPSDLVREIPSGTRLLLHDEKVVTANANEYFLKDAKSPRDDTCILLKAMPCPNADYCILCQYGASAGYETLFHTVLQNFLPKTLCKPRKRKRS